VGKTQTAFSQQNLLQHRLSHGGSLRNVRLGRRKRPLSTRDPIHLSFKARRQLIPGGFRTHRRFQLVHQIVQRYSLKFFVKVEQLSIQGDHWHLVVRTSRRSQFQNFLRVVAGQTAQRFLIEGLMNTRVTSTSDRTKAKRYQGVTDTLVRVTRESREPSETKQKLWLQRPFTRVVKGFRAYRTLQAYVQLNEMEALGLIPYRKERLNGLTPEERERLESAVTDTRRKRLAGFGDRYPPEVRRWLF
jgi:putative transposase